MGDQRIARATAARRRNRDVRRKGEARCDVIPIPGAVACGKGARGAHERREMLEGDADSGVVAISDQVAQAAVERDALLLSTAFLSGSARHSREVETLEARTQNEVADARDGIAPIQRC